MPENIGKGGVTKVDRLKHKRIYWHRELPPQDAEILGEHVVEAASLRVANTMAAHDVLWERRCQDLMANARKRIEQELKRLGGDYAHVLDEFVDSRRDDTKGEAWPHGHFNYVLYKQKQML